VQVVKDTYSDSRGSGSSGGRPQRASAQGSLPRQDGRRDDVQGPSTGDPPSAQRARPSTRYTPSSDTGARPASEADQTDDRLSGPPPQSGRPGSTRRASDKSGARHSALPSVPDGGQGAAGAQGAKAANQSDDKQHVTSHHAGKDSGRQGPPS